MQISMYLSSERNKGINGSEIAHKIRYEDENFNKGMIPMCN